MRRVAVLVALGGLANACEPPPLAARPAPARSPIAESPATVALVGDAPTFARTLFREPDGALLVAVGRWRAKVEGGRITWADQPFASPIADVARVAGGFVFAAEDGLIARSDTFTGALRHVGDVKRRFAPTWSEGRLSYVDDLGAIWTTTGASAPVALSTGGVVLGGAFADANRGAFALDGAVLVRTTDGGAHFTRVALGGPTATNLVAATNVMAHDGRLIAIMADETLARIMDDGKVVPFHEELPRPHLPQELVARVLEGPSPAPKDERARLRESAPVPQSLVSDAYRWGAGAFALLAREDPKAKKTGAYRIFRSHTGSAWESYGAGPAAADQIVFSDDGEHVAWPEPCEEPTLYLGGVRDTMCVHARAHDRGRSWPLKPAAERVVGMRADRVLYLSAEGALESLSGDTGRITELGAPREGLRVVDAAQALDGTLVVVRSDGARTDVEVGEGAAAVWRRLAIPAGVDRVAFADGAHGFAAGAHGNEVWRTRDGGAKWEAVPLPVIGDAAAVALPGKLACDETGCTIGKALVMKGWGAFTAASAPAMAAGAPLGKPATPKRPLLRADHLRCVPTASPGRSVETGPTALAATGARATLAIASDGAGKHTFFAKWDGKDARGSFSAAMQAAAPTTDATWWVLRVATRDGLLVERCPQIALGTGCENLWARSGGGVRNLPFKSAVSEFDTPIGRPLGALPLGDGGAMIALTTRQFDSRSQLSTGPTVDHVLRLDKEGAIVAERTFTWWTDVTESADGTMKTFTASARTRALGTYAGIAGLFVLDRLDIEALEFYPLEKDLHAAPQLVARVTQGTLEACSSPAEPGAPSFMVPAGELLQMFVDPGDKTPRGGTRAFVEVTRGRTCIRRVESWGTGGELREERWAGDGLDVDAQADGGFKGTSIIRGELRAVECRARWGDEVIVK
jgi:hypothetical protein